MRQQMKMIWGHLYFALTHKKKIGNLNLWLSVGVGVITIIGMVIYGSRRYGDPFWTSFLSNWYATFLGVIVGVPIAFWVSNYQERRIEKEKKEKVLELLNDELKLNLKLLPNDFHEDMEFWKSIKAAHLCDEIKTETWDAFSNGGDLQWIKDPYFLGLLSNAYYDIRIISRVSQKYYDLSQLAVNLEVQVKMNQMLNRIFHFSMDARNDLKRAINYTDRMLLGSIYKPMDSK